MGDQSEVQVQDDVDALSPMVEAFLWTLGRARDVTRMTALDEESVTSFIMSGVAVSAPLVINLLGSGSETVSRDCYWGSFKKHGGAESSFSETATGADFALVIGMPNNLARLAIFQAKKSEEAKRSGQQSLDVRRGPASSASGNTQLVMLLAYGAMIMEVVSGQRVASNCGDGETLKVAAKLRDIWLNKCLTEHKLLSCVHYVGYKDQNFVSVSMSALGEKVLDAEFGGAAKVKHPLGNDDQNFFELIERGLIGDGKGWLALDSGLLTDLLPSLVNLGAIFVVDERGGRDLALRGEDAREQQHCGAATALEIKDGQTGSKGVSVGSYLTPRRGGRLHQAELKRYWQSRRLLRNSRSPSQCPGTAPSTTEGGRSLMQIVSLTLPWSAVFSA